MGASGHSRLTRPAHSPGSCVVQLRERWREQTFSKAEIQLAFNLENVCCNKHTKMRFFWVFDRHSLEAIFPHHFSSQNTVFMSLFQKEIYFLNNGNLDIGRLCAELMFASAAPSAVRSLIDNLRFSSAKLWDIWGRRDACVYGLKATGNLVNIR